MGGRGVRGGASCACEGGGDRTRGRKEVTACARELYLAHHKSTVCRAASAEVRVASSPGSHHRTGSQTNRQTDGTVGGAVSALAWPSGSDSARGISTWLKINHHKGSDVPICGVILANAPCVGTVWPVRLNWAARARMLLGTHSFIFVAQDFQYDLYAHRAGLVATKGLLITAMNNHTHNQQRDATRRDALGATLSSALLLSRSRAFDFGESGVQN